MFKMRGPPTITLIHRSIIYTHSPTDFHFPNELLYISAVINEISVNIYIPPRSSCPSNFIPTLPLLFKSRGEDIIMGDFNVHSPAW